jgi:outer membrane protein
MGIQYQSGWLLRCAVAAAAALAVTAAAAADYPTKKAPPPAPAPVVVAPITPGFFVKAGFLYGINQTSSKLYSQIPPGGGLQYGLPGVGATLANVATLGVEVGYYVTPNLSIDVSAGVPMWATDKTKGTPTTFPLPSGTPLAKVMPSFVPVTLLYHFNQFGAVQPYLGAGPAAVFSFQTQDGFDTNVTVEPTVGIVLQGGADVMIDQHWGWGFDVKKLFAHAESHGTGENFALLGLGPELPVASSQRTYFEPWVLSTGVTYRF